MNLVDTNVIVDLLDFNSPFKDWSEQLLLIAQHNGGLAINPIIYTELAALPSTLTMLADFFIGAQAQAEGWTLLTRDAARYKTYFPGVTLICPV